MLPVLRGIALRKKKLNDSALQCFKRSLSNKKRVEALLHRALFERAGTYARMNKRVMVIKDLERILVDEPTHEEVEEKLAKLQGAK